MTEEMEIEKEEADVCRDEETSARAAQQTLTVFTQSVARDTSDSRVSSPTQYHALRVRHPQTQTVKYSDHDKIAIERAHAGQGFRGRRGRRGAV